MRPLISSSLLVAFLVLMAFGAACSWPLTTGEKGAAIGTGVGAGAGAVIGHQSGHGGEGAVIGGAVGAISGGVVGDSMDQDEINRRRKEEMLKGQRREFERQEREIQDLKRQQYHDEYFRQRYGDGAVGEDAK